MRRLNTNISALKINKQLSQTSDKLQQSIKRMGSGLRINKAADDASGIAIAYSLRSQILGIGQGIKNANDGLSVVQLVDGAMEECINIANTIKTKAIQAAQDGQTFESRKMLQRDIDKLLEEIDSISSSTSFNGQKLLSGNFSNKSFQAGGNAGETISFSVSSSETTQIGRITATDMYVTQEGPLSLDITGAFDGKVYNVVGPTFQYDNSKEHGMIALEKAINALSSKTGVQAKATVSTTSPTAITTGRIEDLEINGVFIGDLTVEENDQNGVLLKAINNKTIETGVQASINNEGKLTLVSDGRALEMTGDVHEVLGYSGNVKTFGRMQLLSSGPVIPNIEQSNTTASSGVSANSIYSSVTYSGQSPSSIEGEAEAAFEYAVSIWESVLDLSNVPLDIHVNFVDDLPSGVLASGGAASYRENFIGAPLADVRYVTPLANNIGGVDLTPSAADIWIKLNNNSNINWYFGTDGNPGPDEYDLVTVMLHEIGHGLGFISGYDEKDVSDHFLIEDDPFIFDTFLEDGDGNNFANDMNSADREDAVTSNDLWWKTNGG